MAALTACGVDFVAAEVHDIVVEEAGAAGAAGQVLQQVVEQLVRGVGRGVERLEAARARADLRVAFAPDRGVAGAVDFDHHADATLAAELDDLGHVERGVALLRGVGALLREQGAALRVEGERLLVDKAAGSGLGETSEQGWKSKRWRKTHCQWTVLTLE